MRRKRRLGRLGLTAAMLAAVAVTLGASDDAEAKRRKRIIWTQVYSVPFTCGSATTATGAVLVGDYATTVLASNPDVYDAELTTRISFTSPSGQIVSEPVDEILAPGASVQFDCDAILGAGFLFPTPPPPVEVAQGFVLIESRSPLSVSALHVSGGPAGDVSTTLTQIAPSARRWVPDAEAKVAICHVPPGNPSNARTIHVGASAVPAHEGHGDTRGACP